MAVKSYHWLNINPVRPAPSLNNTRVTWNFPEELIVSSPQLKKKKKDYDKTLKQFRAAYVNLKITIWGRS